MSFFRPEVTLLVGPPVGVPEYLIAEIKLPGVVRYTHTHYCNSLISGRSFFFFLFVPPQLNSTWFILGNFCGNGTRFFKNTNISAEEMSLHC